MSIRHAFCETRQLFHGRRDRDASSERPELVSYLFFASLIATTFLF